MELVIGFALAFLAAVAGTMAALWWRQRAQARHLADTLERERQRAEHANHAGDAFFSLVSHEFRSPIAAIIGYQELLGDSAYGELGDAAREPLDRIGQSAQHLLHLVDGALDLARIPHARLQPTFEDTDLQTLLEEVADAFRIQCADRSLRFAVRLDDRLPTIRTDPERLARALHLLVISAVKNPAGDRLELAATAEPDGATVHIRGTRIPIRDQATDPALRSGIRIAIAAATADLLGGNLRLEPDRAPQATQATFRIRHRPDT